MKTEYDILPGSEPRMLAGFYFKEGGDTQFQGKEGQISSRRGGTNKFWKGCLIRYMLLILYLRTEKMIY